MNIKVKEIEKSETLLINELSRQQENDGKKIYKFGFGQSPFSPPEFLVESLKSHAYRHEYMPVQGITELREAVTKFHETDLGQKYDKDNVFIAPGSKILLFSVMATLENATIILPNPSWVSYAPQAKLLKHEVKWVETSFDTMWKVTAEELEKTGQNLDPDRQALMILNTPCNPTGSVYTPEELKALAVVARKWNILILSDEIYGPLTFEGTHISIAQYYPEGTIVTTGLSKWCGAGGWRLGVAFLPQELSGAFKETLLGVASETYSTATAPVQLAAVDAYNNISRAAKFIDAEKHILKIINNYCARQLSAAGVKVHPAGGGFYLYPSFENFREKLAAKGITTSQKLCEELLRDASVALLPSVTFGHNNTALCCRLCYVDFDGNALVNNPEVLNESDESIKEHAPNIVAGIQAMINWLNAL